MFLSCAVSTPQATLKVLCWYGLNVFIPHFVTREWRKMQNNCGKVWSPVLYKCGPRLEVKVPWGQGGLTFGLGFQFITYSIETWPKSFILLEMKLWLVNLVSWFCSKTKCVLCSKYFRYLHKTNTIVFTIILTIRWATFHLSSTIPTLASLFACVIYSSSDAHC